MMVAGNIMKNTSGWKNNGNGTNESGFSAIPGGLRYLFGSCESFDQAYWWSSSESNNYIA
jgi:uncharacterized protein (TIGR02145 family)